MSKKPILFLLMSLLIIPCISACSFSDNRTENSSSDVTKTYNNFIQEMTKTGKKNYRLKSDIVMPDDTYITYSLGDFFGTFDGQGHTLKNFKVVIPYSHYSTIADMDAFGLFSVLKEDSIIRNVKLENFEIHVDSVVNDRVVGGLVGIQEKDTSIENIQGNIIGTVDARSSCISFGGLVGESYGIINDIDIDIDIGNYTEYIAGGLIGQGDVTLSRARVDGRLTSYGKHTGGIIGVSYTSKLNEIFTDISMTVIPRLSGNVGGIAGILGFTNHYPSIIQDAIAVGSIQIFDTSKTINVGGIVGQIYLDSYVRDAISLVNIYDSEKYQFFSQSHITLGAISGKSGGTSTVRNGVFSSNLGITKAIGNLPMDPLYHLDMPTSMLRDGISLDTFNEKWDIIETYYPILSFMKDGYIGNFDKPIMVETIADLNNIHIKPWAHYILMNDLLFLEESPQTRFAKNKPFCGIFDGKLHRFLSLRFHDCLVVDASIFRYIASAEICHLRLSDVDIFVNQYDSHDGGYGLIAHEAYDSVVEKIEIVGKCVLSVINQTSGFFGFVVGAVFGQNSRFEYIITDGFFILVDTKVDETGDYPETVVGGVFGYVSGEKQHFRKILAFAVTDYHSSGIYPSNRVAVGFGRIDHADIYVTESRHIRYLVDGYLYYPSFKFANHVTPDRMVEIPAVMEEDWDIFDDEFIDVIDSSFRLSPSMPL